MGILQQIKCEISNPVVDNDNQIDNEQDNVYAMFDGVLIVGPRREVIERIRLLAAEQGIADHIQIEGEQKTWEKSHAERAFWNKLIQENI